MSLLAQLAKNAFNSGYRVTARCQRHHIGVVTAVTRNAKGHVVLKGHRRGNPKKKWQTVRPRSFRVFADYGEAS